MHKRLYHTGFIAYLLLFILSVLLYKERTIFLDAAFHVFQIVINNDFTIQHYRYGVIFTEIFPLLCAKLSLPLDFTLLAYSSGFIVYYTTCYWICGSVLKQYELALSLLLFNILFVTDTFYWIPSELPQGIAFMLVMFALLKSTKFEKYNLVKLILLLPVMILAVSFHPIIWIPAVFIVVFYAINSQELTSRGVFFAGSILFFILFYIKTKVFINSYDAYAMNKSDKLFQSFPHWIDLEPNRRFLKLCMGSFIWIPISFLLTTITYFIQKNWLSLLFFLLFFISYLLIINTVFATAEIIPFYLENLYLPLALILAIPIVYDVLPLLNSRKLAVPFMVLIIITGLVRIHTTHNTYTNRLNWQRSLMDRNEGKKLLIAETPALKDTLIMAWGTPFECWLLSTTETGKTASIYIADDIDKFWNEHWDRTSFITPWNVLPYKDLPTRYFKFTDTVNRYEVVR